MKKKYIIRSVVVLAIIVVLKFVGAGDAHSCNPFKDCSPFNADSKKESGTK